MHVSARLYSSNHRGQLRRTNQTNRTGYRARHLALLLTNWYDQATSWQPAQIPVCQRNGNHCRQMSSTNGGVSWQAGAGPWQAIAMTSTNWLLSEYGLQRWALFVQGSFYLPVPPRASRLVELEYDGRKIISQPQERPQMAPQQNCRDEPGRSAAAH